VPRYRVILAAHGEAASRRWREHFAVGYRTLAHASEVMHLPLALRLLVCALGATRKRFSALGASPHNALTQAQAEALEVRLGQSFSVEAAFLAAPPLLHSALERSGGVERQFVCSMMPTDSRLACGQLCRAVGSQGRTLPPTAVLARLWDDPAFIEVNRLHALAHAPEAVQGEEQPVLVLALHGTLLRDRQGRPVAFHNGASEKQQFAHALREALLQTTELPWQRVEIAYLNHGVGGHWSAPDMAELLSGLATQGVHRVQVFACDYLVDGGETRHGLADVLQASAIPLCEQLPCLNAAPLFMDYLAQRIHMALAGEAYSMRCDQCPRSA
jgi:ferrochelatase